MYKIKEKNMKENISIKNIFILLGIIFGSLIIVWVAAALPIFIHDEKENKERGERIYNELSEKYGMSGGYSFEMDYTYSRKKNIGFIGGGGYVDDECWERYIRDAWTNQEIATISFCKNEKITKEKLEELEEFWKEYKELF